MSVDDSDAIWDTVNQPQASQQFVNAVIGPAVVGWMVSILLFGFLVSATYHYITSSAFARDSRLAKTTLVVVVVLALAQTSLQMWTLYHYATWQDRDAYTIYDQTAVDTLATFFVCWEAAIVQVFLAQRARGLITNAIVSWIYLVVVGFGILGGLIGAKAYFVLSILLRQGRLESAEPMNFSIATGIWVGSSAVTDLLITGSLLLLLYRQLGGLASTDSLLRRLMRLALRSGAPVTITYVITAAMNFSIPDGSLYTNASTAFWLPLPALIALTLLANLHGRAELRDENRDMLAAGKQIDLAFVPASRVGHTQSFPSNGMLRELASGASGVSRRSNQDALDEKSV